MSDAINWPESTTHTVGKKYKDNPMYKAGYEDCKKELIPLLKEGIALFAQVEKDTGELLDKELQWINKVNKISEEN